VPFGSFAPLPLRLGGSAEEGWAPEHHARFVADLVSVKRTAPLARLLVNQDPGTPFAATVAYYSGQNGSGVLYAPTIAVTGAGDVTLTWPGYWEDEFGIQHALKIRQAIARSYSTAAQFPVCVISARTVRVRTFTDAGAASALPFSLRAW